MAKTVTIKKPKIEAINTPEHIKALRTEIEHMKKNVLYTEYDTGQIKDVILILQHRVIELEKGKELSGRKYITP
tara:strand:+ start:177 stop:398 length:222 start_codon:yes stop_codon:yes gene_type:complete